MGHGYSYRRSQFTNKARTIRQGDSYACIILGQRPRLYVYKENRAFRSPCDWPHFPENVIKFRQEEDEKMILPGGESNPALARPVEMTGACTNPIYYQGLHHVTKASYHE